MKPRIWIVFLLLIQIVVHGQSQEIVFVPPSFDFISLSLQTHEGKLRFGNQDEYFQKSDGTYISSRDDGYFEMDRRSSHNRASRHAFVELLKMRFKKEMFSAMDRNYFTATKAKYVRRGNEVPYRPIACTEPGQCPLQQNTIQSLVLQPKRGGLCLCFSKRWVL